MEQLILCRVWSVRIAAGSFSGGQDFLPYHVSIKNARRSWLCGVFSAQAETDGGGVFGITPLACFNALATLVREIFYALAS
jgi:hypothetical protein